MYISEGDGETTKEESGKHERRRDNITMPTKTNSENKRLRWGRNKHNVRQFRKKKREIA